MEDGLAEVLGVDGDDPVVGLVLFVEARLEVEGVEVAVIRGDAGGAHELGGGRIGLPSVQQVGVHVAAIDLTGEEQLSGNGGSIRVVGLLDALDVDVLGIPVVLVLHIDALLLSGQGLEDIGAVEVHVLVIDAEILAPGLQHGSGSGPVAAKAHRGEES